MWGNSIFLHHTYCTATKSKCDRWHTNNGPNVRHLCARLVKVPICSLKTRFPFAAIVWLEWHSTSSGCLIGTPLGIPYLFTQYHNIGHLLLKTRVQNPFACYFSWSDILKFLFQNMPHSIRIFYLNGYMRVPGKLSWLHPSLCPCSVTQGVFGQRKWLLAGSEQMLSSHL